MSEPLINLAKGWMDFYINIYSILSQAAQLFSCLNDPVISEEDKMNVYCRTSGWLREVVTQTIYWSKHLNVCVYGFQFSLVFMKRM